MIDDPPDRRADRPPMTPQLALRVAIVGTFALAMFAIIFFRLWFLQVLTGQPVRRAGAGNVTRHIPMRGAARGDPRLATATCWSTRRRCRRSRSRRATCRLRSA